MKEYFNTKPIKGQIQKAIAEETAKALMYFCEREPEFRQAVEQSGKTFQQCLDAVAKGVGKSISDLQAYQKAVEFYFFGAKVHFIMQIDLTGQSENLADLCSEAALGGSSQAQVLRSVSLDDLLDF